MSAKGLPLTGYPEGSLRELLRISLPLILSFLSGSLMFFCDRTMLAHYSLESMNAAAIGGSNFWMFVVAAIAVASIAEVFVGQHNGAGRHRRIGEPVWQMLYFSAATALVFVPVGLLFAENFVRSESHLAEGVPYFRNLMLGGCFHAAFAALAGFYIGRGRVLMVTLVTIVGQTINGLLDWAFIFGVDGWIDPMGAGGAALATSIATCVEVGILLVGFLRPTHRAQFGTGDCRFHSETFYQCLKIGVPSGAGHMVEVSIGAYLAISLARLSEDHITVLAVGQNLFVTFMFCIEGLQKGVIALVSNFIGAEKWHLIPATLAAAIQTLFFTTAILAIPLVLYPQPILDLFLPDSSSVTPELMAGCRTALLGVWLYFLFDGITWVIGGVLIAAGDTKFVMVINVITTILFAGIPVYVLVVHWHGSPGLTWMLYPIYAVMNGLCFFARYWHGGWKKLNLMEKI